MTIGILVCDHVLEELLPIQGAYDVMYAELLEGMKVKPFFICDDDFPSSPEECDGWLVGGSVRSVYEDIDWIKKLEDFTREVHDSKRPYVGICFGHQMLAHALGGEVKRAKEGWCLAGHDFNVDIKENWMRPFDEKIRVLMLCQDQVVDLPPDSRILANNESCPIGMFTVGNNMLGIQGHPEFTKEYNGSIIQMREEKLGNEVVEKSLESLNMSVDHLRIAGWIRAFFEEKITIG